MCFLIFFHCCCLPQWNVDIVYQEDYFALLNATETGRRITYNPTNIITYTEDFGEYMKNAVQEVRITLPRLLFPSLSLRETTTNIESECNYMYGSA